VLVNCLHPTHSRAGGVIEYTMSIKTETNGQPDGSRLVTRNGVEKKRMKYR
jgi:hypothetical protein